MRNDCTLADSVATTADFFGAEQSIITDSKPYLGDWFAGPLKIDGGKVVLPNGAWTGPLVLTVTGSKLTGHGRVDSLEGRELISKKDGKKHFYDFVCEATVVEKGSIIVNKTSCANP